MPGVGKNTFGEGWGSYKEGATTLSTRGVDRVAACITYATSDFSRAAQQLQALQLPLPPRPNSLAIVIESGFALCYSA